MQESNHKKIKRYVTVAFMYALAIELSKSAGDDDKLSMMQKLAAIGAVNSIVNILRNKCMEFIKIADEIEELKMQTWDALAEVYSKEEVVLNLPTAIESIYHSNFEWMSAIKNLDSNISRMTMLCISKEVDPKLSRIVSDQYEDILSGVVYKYLKDRNEKAI